MDSLFALQQIANLKFRQSEGALAKVTNRENQLRAELKRLQDLARETHSQPASDAELRAIGGDIIWLKWLSDNQKRLSIELAQILAQKERLLATFRKELGKKSVTDELLTQSKSQARQKKAKKRLDQAVDISLVQQSFKN
ncbi:hypothetical protein [Tateyamaria sp. ANG-S1]|uniref:hypothetical protein n=1 Tax=Tateyamaria sp. ANG-S1 TaxID=1577905 RepID=UPI00057F6B72|nr:hypothetical protein [Tateyamaria sp. ANG-S1]KIC49632.1 hypothetical protein RA29_08140 [Tateyamaria sp. ANG-S1]